MAKIHTLKISNYRGIEKFEQVFNDSNLVCLIGRGDSGKTTILQAISAVLSPNWDYNFYDTDFFKGHIENPIEIEVSLYDIPDELLIDSKYGLYKRLLNTDNKIVDDITTDVLGDNKDILTIRLIVNQDLEPKWYVVNGRDHQEDVEIRAGDRAKLNAFFVSDYLDRHFSWGKGTPLYSLLKQSDIDIETDKIITDANRKAKDCIEKSESFKSFDSVLEKIKKTSTSIGLSADELEVFIDFKNTLVKDGNITLHKDGIPYRMNGKGTKRLLSIAIQLEVAKQGGIILIDELEQGLEPDRVKFLAKCLKDKKQGQIFITTHSSNVLVELEARDIFLKKKDSKTLFSFNLDFQGCIRKNPEAFFAKRLIICEGATEIGICRALNNFRIENDKTNLSVLGISLVDGTGSKFIEYCDNLKSAGFDVCVLCDSDDKGVNGKKEKLIANGIKIVDCDYGNAIEQQLFNDLPWNKVKELIDYTVKDRTEQSILYSTGKKSINELVDQDNTDIRILLGEKAKNKENGWYKRVDHGEFIGKLWFDSLFDMKDKTLKKQYDYLTSWIDR